MLYIKLAQYSGFNLDIDSPWIPKEWIQPMKLTVKPSSFDFIDNFDIFSPFDDDPASWCTNAGRYSPRSPDLTPLMFEQIAAELDSNQ